MWVAQFRASSKKLVVPVEGRLGASWVRRSSPPEGIEWGVWKAQREGSEGGAITEEVHNC